MPEPKLSQVLHAVRPNAWKTAMHSSLVSWTIFSSGTHSSSFYWLPHCDSSVIFASSQTCTFPSPLMCKGCGNSFHWVGGLSFPGSSVVKNPPASAGDVGWIPGSGVKWQPCPVFLPGECWTEESGRLQSLGSHRLGHRSETKQQQQRVLNNRNLFLHGYDMKGPRSRCL